jgi:hypothetical protein
MTAARLLADLRGRGAIVEVVGDRLRVDAPVGVVTAADRAALVEHKAELLASPCWAAPSREPSASNPTCRGLDKRISCPFSATSTFARGVPQHSPAQPRHAVVNLNAASAARSARSWSKAGDERLLDVSPAGGISRSDFFSCPVSSGPKGTGVRPRHARSRCAAPRRAGTEAVLRGARLAQTGRPHRLDTQHVSSTT